MFMAHSGFLCDLEDENAGIYFISPIHLCHMALAVPGKRKLSWSWMSAKMSFHSLMEKTFFGSRERCTRLRMFWKEFLSKGSGLDEEGRMPRFFCSEKQ